MKKQYFKFCHLMICTMILMTSCESESIIENPTTFVSTSEMTNISSVSAEATGDVDAINDENIEERGFVYGTSVNPTLDDNKLSVGSGSGNFSATIPDLEVKVDYFLRAYALSNEKIYYGNEVGFSASEPLELIINGDFTLPDDLGDYEISDVPNWHSSETNNGLIGRSVDSDFDPSNSILWTSDSSQGFFHLIGKVPQVKSDYRIKFDGNFLWTDWGEYSTDIEITFSVYDGENTSNRTVVGSTKINTGVFPGWGNNWRTYEGDYSIPADSEFAGKNLLVDFNVLPYDGPLNAGVWFNFDNISIIQTLK